MKKEGYLYCTNANCNELIIDVPVENILKTGEEKVVLKCPKCGAKYEISNVDYEYDI